MHDFNILKKGCYKGDTLIPITSPAEMDARMAAPYPIAFHQSRQKGLAAALRRGKSFTEYGYDY